ncbi:MAG TPA: hypothetical protein VGQ30_07560 [Gemmatimonadaceae bacterium]|jgi:hypothetical protein|nr:hypothetical protein [Gemmatimonadaceae bacterium]
MKMSARKVPPRILIGALALTLAGHSLAAQGPRPHPADEANAIRTIVIKLQSAIRGDQRRTIATLILFPMEIIKAPLGLTRVPSVRVFMTVYPSVFTRKLRDAILRQNPDSIVVRNGTATFADGRVVIGYRCATTDPNSCATGVTQIRPYKN